MNRIPHFAEVEVVVVCLDVSAQVAGEDGARLVQAGTIGTVVHVHAHQELRAAYEVEFFLGSDTWGLATILEKDLMALSDGRVFLGLVSTDGPRAAMVRVAVSARSLDDAQARLKERWGPESVLSVWNAEDADRPR
jgi:hypothetical protein